MVLEARIRKEEGDDAMTTKKHAGTIYTHKTKTVFAAMVPLDDHTAEELENFIDWMNFVDLEFESGRHGSVEILKNRVPQLCADPGEWIVKLGDGEFEVFTQEDFDANFVKPALATAFQIRFDGPPGHQSGRFVEVEDATGRSIKVGEWVQDGDSWWLLKIPASEELTAARADYDGACKLVAKMHEAAVGEVTGPRRGVVEDVEDVHARALFAEKAVRDLDAAHRLDHPEGSDSCRTCAALDAIDTTVDIFGQPSWLARMKDALKRYAAPENWEWFTDTRGFKEGGVQALRWKGGCYQSDGGDFARDALANVEPGRGRRGADQVPAKTSEDPRAVVDEQAEDEGLWIVSNNIVENYLQAALRRLHAAVEGKPS
jgi:hypothetical protein